MLLDTFEQWGGGNFQYKVDIILLKKNKKHKYQGLCVSTL